MLEPLLRIRRTRFTTTTTVQRSNALWRRPHLYYSLVTCRNHRVLRRQFRGWAASSAAWCRDGKRLASGYRLNYGITGTYRAEKKRKKRRFNEACITIIEWRSFANNSWADSRKKAQFDWKGKVTSVNCMVWHEWLRATTNTSHCWSIICSREPQVREREVALLCVATRSHAGRVGLGWVRCPENGAAKTMPNVNHSYDLSIWKEANLGFVLEK